ncbi:hypothetical protein F4805DRAFT_457755 [Annulohypoxylon moriforme]|nr:hypothetical protein F4805DRAFT_457755 [Annulohypoxylon moriforme]
MSSSMNLFPQEKPRLNHDIAFEEFCSLNNLVHQIEALDLPEIEEYKRFIFSNFVYQWLLGRLRREITLSQSNTKPHILEGIGNKIRRAIHQKSHISRSISPEYIRITYILDWDILLFLHAQEYDLPGADAVANVVTLTGSSVDAQALSCRDYLAQMWPHTGHKTLKLLQNTLRANGSYSEIFTSPSPMSISIEIKGPSVSVNVSGIQEFVVEIAEQLAWLGAALRSSPFDVGVAHSTPNMYPTDSTVGANEDLRFAINYLIDDGVMESLNRNGQCWHSLFVNPIIVHGFPILNRLELNTGLESPLAMLVTLARARYVDTFKSKVFIKGFSTMLVPTKQSKDLLIWHLLYNQDPNERISYLDCGLEHADIDINALEHYRHVLGWCSNAIPIAGTTRANYKIEKSRLPEPHPGCSFEKVSISGGKFVTGTASFSLGNREKPMSSKHFVFWDEEEKRGWLVNGACALLHVLRASLEYSQRKFQSAWLLDPNALRDAPEGLRSGSALDILISEKNRNLTLYVDKTEVYDEVTNDQQINHKVSKKKTTYYQLENRIEHIYSILEKLIDHQTDVERRSGLDIKIQPRRQLEGWDFKDLATDGDPFFARVTHLQTIGKGRVDFTRALHAVTLFGRGFGDLIQPQFGKGKATSCPLWSIVPKDKYYLTACISDLQEIMENSGDLGCNPRILCENIVWHMKQTTFDLCPCNKGGTNGHHDPVQVLFPLKFMKNLKKKPQVELETQGAVIFGHNMNIHWHWKDHGDPVKGDPPQELENITNTFSSSSGSGSSPESPNSHSTSDPNSSRSEATNSTPVHTSESPLSDPGNTIPNPTKRRFQGMLSSSFKRARISHSNR